jgi:hypothetical protein
MTRRVDRTGMVSNSPSRSASASASTGRWNCRRTMGAATSRASVFRNQRRCRRRFGFCSSFPHTSKTGVARLFARHSGAGRNPVATSSAFESSLWRSSPERFNRHWIPACAGMTSGKRGASYTFSEGLMANAQPVFALTSSSDTPSCSSISVRPLPFSTENTHRSVMIRSTHSLPVMGRSH